jgi:hypothetical protein
MKIRHIPTKLVTLRGHLPRRSDGAGTAMEPQSFGLLTQRCASVIRTLSELQFGVKLLRYSQTELRARRMECRMGTPGMRGAWGSWGAARDPGLTVGALLRKARIN